jgi:hypothetical protein
MTAQNAIEAARETFVFATDADALSDVRIAVLDQEYPA